MAQIVRVARPRIDAFLKPLLGRDSLRIVFTGAGTSAFGGEIVAPRLSQVLRRRVDAVATTDIVSAPACVFGDDVPTLLVSFARSGNSPESVAATEVADRMLSEAHHLIITCAADGELAWRHRGRSRSLVLVAPPQANDEGFAMTSSITSMVLAALAVFLGDDALDVAALAAGAQQVLDREDRIAALAALLPGRLEFLGSGPLAGAGRESALKSLELTAGETAAFFDTPMGLRHGPKSVLTPGALAVVYLSSDPYTRAYDLDITAELRGSLGDDNVVTLGAPGEGAADGRTEPLGGVPTLEIPALAGLDDAQRAIVDLVFAQLFALHSSAARGLTPDNPFPSGVLNRVVQGVTIHPLAGRAGAN
jgi:tagatose-6-phosphate ketose/aldose isomerase